MAEKATVKPGPKPITKTDIEMDNIDVKEEFMVARLEKMMESGADVLQFQNLKLDTFRIIDSDPKGFTVMFVYKDPPDDIVRGRFAPFLQDKLISEAAKMSFQQVYGFSKDMVTPESIRMVSETLYGLCKADLVEIVEIDIRGMMALVHHVEQETSKELQRVSRL